HPPRSPPLPYTTLFRSSSKPCAACGGHRLKPEALAVKIAGLNISEVAEFSVEQAFAWFEALEPKLTDKQREIAQRILKEIRERRSEEHTSELQSREKLV